MRVRGGGEMIFGGYEFLGVTHFLGTFVVGFGYENELYNYAPIKKVKTLGGDL